MDESITTDVAISVSEKGGKKLRSSIKTPTGSVASNMPPVSPVNTRGSTTPPSKPVVIHAPSGPVSIEGTRDRGWDSHFR
ncbi:hypothetical protein LTR78_005245 [Recurvomyces mirabilis]|uniref:Uncharacterized protein n=1 Tax=Recurvomyces mirabilis TaxID=574656 RepID=A0AAE0WND5_9PEZI|nr:hypothetical protein LTR78_005245 [Recurvomyces mirabilis]KAK5157795.1 hypothetical protein LTS14_003717 [Recurvomyces mirabilis]